jgi:beta-glucosidase
MAAAADVALVFVGTSEEWESEGFDRPDMELPGRQVELIERVAAANPSTVVVLNNGSPLTMDWIEHVPALLEAWFPGQECGNAIADVLFGDVNPSGKLPQTFPMRLEDNPAYITYPGDNGRVVYGEGLFVGYRYYDKKAIKPRFPFGYGLSYTSFTYDNLRLDKDAYELGEPITVSIDITNNGDVAGKEIVQLYVSDVESSLMRPPKELKAFAKVALAPGETKTVERTLGPNDLKFYDDARHAWVAEDGEFEVLVGSSSQAIHAAATFTLSVPEAPVGEASAAALPLSRQSTLRQILANPAGKAILAAHLPDMVDSPQVDMAMDMTLDAIAGFVPHMLPPETVEVIDGELQALEDG